MIIKTTYTSEYLVGSDETSTYNRLPNTVLNTVKKDLQLTALPAPKTTCNVIALGDIITQELVSSGALKKVVLVGNIFEQTGAFKNISFGFAYERLLNGVWVEEFAVNTYLKGLATVGSLVSAEELFFDNVGVDLLSVRYAVELGGDIRNVQLIMWYGDGQPLGEVTDALEITTPPTLTSLYIQITQEA